MDRLKRFLFGQTEETSIEANLGLLVLRISGLFMAFGHGFKKLPPSEGFMKGVAKMGFPLPEFFAWSASLAEGLGGILIAIGLLTRPSALMLGLTMAVAAFIKHGPDDFGSKEKALLYLIICLVLVLKGAGKYSIDARINPTLRS